MNGTRGLGYAPRKRAANHSPRSNSASWQSRSRASNFGLPHIFPVGDSIASDPAGGARNTEPRRILVRRSTRPHPRLLRYQTPLFELDGRISCLQLIVGPAARFAVDLTNGLRPYGPSARDSPSATPSSPGRRGQT